MVQRSISTSDLGSSVVDVGTLNTNGLLSGVNWDVENDLFTSDFIAKYPLPHLALITKGQHLHVGAPNVANPALRPYVLLYAKKKVRKVLAEVVRTKEGRRGPILAEQKIAIPEGYHGFFEILSEEGRPTRALEVVKDLFKSFPELCVVRAPCKAYLPDEEGRIIRTITNKTRQVESGEVLTLVGQFNYKKTSYLRCFDELGKSIYLKMSQKGKFSPVAHKDAISGVHYIKNIMETKRFPLTVRLIQGSLPPDLKIYSSSCPTLKLKAVFQEEVLLAYVLHREGELISVPLNSFMKFAPSYQHHQLSCRTEYRAILNFCDRNCEDFLNRLTAFNDQHVDLRLPTPQTSVEPEKVPSPVDDEEIDQLYDYIRGFAPLPTTCQKPAPPPLETLPSRKSDEPPPEKTRLRSKERRGYVKHGEHTGGSNENRHRWDRKHHLSKSTEKLTQPAQFVDDVQRRSKDKPHTRQKFRPISMVVPDRVALFPNGQEPLRHSKFGGSSHRFPSATNLHYPEVERFSPGAAPPGHYVYKPPLFHRYPIHRY